ncbi:MFS transporter [Litorimonas sp. RW-G-Af-16]|uniref:AmpG family muropeptide MFS transporter n=1 Tax=Litorimonas sp. RW-G-Af-16 TaxID=3241168 RepID=UPI003AAA3E08
MENQSPTLTILKKVDEFFLISEIFASRKMAAMLALGFSAGLPIMLVYTTLSAWLREVGVSRTAIGFFIWVSFAYSLKFLWAPLTDRVRIPILADKIGNRLAWTFVAIIGVVISMVAMGFQDPSQNLQNVAICAIFIAFFSATLDICVDAWRVDAGEDKEQATLAAVYQLGYRFGMILAISGVLWVAQTTSWNIAYWCVAAIALVGASIPFWASRMPEPEAKPFKDIKWSRFAIIIPIIAVVLIFKKYADIGDLFYLILTVLALPFVFAAGLLIWGKTALSGSAIYEMPIVGDFADIVRRYGWLTLLILLIVMTYRISDYTMGVMAMPLYIDLGYDKGTIGQVKGLFGVVMLMVGAFAGGWSAVKFGLPRTLIVGAFLTIVTNLAFAWLAQIEAPLTHYLLVTIGADNLAAGFAGTAIIAFMSLLTNKDFTATQYALFSSLVAFSGKSLAGFSGALADMIDYQNFFIVTAMFGLPPLIAVIVSWQINLLERGKAKKAGQGSI